MHLMGAIIRILFMRKLWSDLVHRHFYPLCPAVFFLPFRPAKDNQNEANQRRDVVVAALALDKS